MPQLRTVSSQQLALISIVFSSKSKITISPSIRHLVAKTLRGQQMMPFSSSSLVSTSGSTRHSIPRKSLIRWKVSIFPTRMMLLQTRCQRSSKPTFTMWMSCTHPVLAIFSLSTSHHLIARPLDRREVHKMLLIAQSPSTLITRSLRKECKIGVLRIQMYALILSCPQAPSCHDRVDPDELCSLRPRSSTFILG